MEIMCSMNLLEGSGWNLIGNIEDVIFVARKIFNAPSILNIPSTILNRNGNRQSNIRRPFCF